MKFVLFYHSLVSDWNHGNAHFLRGVVSELISLGHDVQVYEPADGWSLKNLMEEQGPGAIAAFRRAYPELASQFYTADTLDLDRVLDGADVVIVHEWNPQALIERIGKHAARNSYRALFHDTHHRSVTDPQSLEQLDLSHYDGVLAFGATIRDVYLQRNWAQRVWVWHEAADTRRFHPPVQRDDDEGDLTWVGNWGDGERTRELQEFLLDPIAALQLRARIYGVRYPADARQALARAGAEYGGWIANYRVPEVFAHYKFTVHVPRRAYSEALAGIPTIRVFEALACGIPLVSAPWEDSEALFRPGSDYLVARTGKQMQEHLHALRNDPTYAKAIADSGLARIRERHTCAHRVRELLAIVDELATSPHLAAQRAGA